MSAFESSLLAGGLFVGVVLGWILRGIIRPFAVAGGTVEVGSAVTCTPTGITVTVSPQPNTGCKVLRLYTYLAPDTTTSFPGAEDEPPGTSATHEPQAGTFSITHPVTGMPGGQQRLFVFAGFGVHGHGLVDFTCGSGSGSTFKVRPALFEPAARQYRLTGGGVAHPDASPEVRRALERGEVNLAFDPLRSAGGEAVWSEEVPAGETVSWRLTLRKAEGAQVAALEVVNGSVPAMVWRCRQWHFFAGSRFVPDPGNPAGRLLPSLEVHPA